MKTKKQSIQFIPFIGLLLTVLSNGYGQQTTSLETLFQLAEKNNTTLQISEQAVKTQQYRLKAAQLAFLPDLHLTSAYTYLGKPLQMDLQDMKESIVEGTSKQNVQLADKLYTDLTGNGLSDNAKQTIYDDSRKVITEVYPNYHVEMSKQHYFTAGIDMTIPIYMGGKHAVARELAQQQFNSSKLHQQVAQNLVDFGIVSQYLRIQYLNNLVLTQEKLVQTYEATTQKAESLVEQQIIPPYQANWSRVGLSQAQSTLQQLQMSKENALIELNELIGKDTILVINDTLKEVPFLLALDENTIIATNSNYQWLEAKSLEAKSFVKLSRSASLPNIVGVANYQFAQKNLPVITPPWMVGVGFRWNIFSNFTNYNNIKASKSLYEESKLLLQQKEQELNVKNRVLKNNIQSAHLHLQSLNEAKNQAALAVNMVEKRVENQMASIKDLDDALKIQLEAEKAYYTSLLSYNLSIAAYLESKGEPKSMANLLK